MISLPLINPLRFSSTLGNYEFDHNSDYCYFQKWQYGDILNLQFLSDGIVTLKLLSLEEGLIKKEFTSNKIENGLIDVDFEVHEFSIFFDENIDYGKYVFIIDLDSVYTYYSNPINYQEEFSKTVLFKYRNTYNDQNLIFDTGIEFYFRVEGTVQMFNPKIDHTTYIDQKKNATLLSATPYRYFTLFVGIEHGIPDWAIDLVNRILCTDVKKVDNLLFEITEDSELESIRIDNYAMSAASIEITEKENPLTQVFDEQYYLADNEGNFIITNNSLNIIK